MSTVGATLSSQLSSIVGPENVSGDAAELLRYRIAEKSPMAIVRPTSSEQVVEIVRFAVAEKLTIVPSGSRTKLDIGMPPARYDLALDMTKLSRVIAYDPQDLTLAVEAGIPLREITSLLARQRQFLPLATPFAERATVGGTIASAVDGPLRQFYGTARDYVLGMEFVTGDGILAKSGGRVVKNVSGYDLHKLMIGALGTLGVVTRINFRTFPVQEPLRAYVVSFKSASDAIELRHKIAQSPFRPMALEILSPRAANIVTGAATNSLSPPFRASNWNLIIVAAGSENGLDRLSRELAHMAEQSGSEGIGSLDPKETHSLLGQLSEFIPLVLHSAAGATIMKISLLVSRMEELLKTAIRAAESNSLEWATAARGVGVIYFALLPGECSEENRQRVLQATKQIFSECTLEANASIPWCPAEWKSTLQTWGPDRPDFQQMRRLKAVFDPNSILSPGRFVGGL